MQRAALASLLGVMLAAGSVLLVGCKSEEATAPEGDAESQRTASPAVDTDWQPPEPDIGELPVGVQSKIIAAGIVLQGDSTDVRQVSELGALFYAHDLAAAAAKCFERATALEPEELSWWYALALAREPADAAEGAIAAYERVLVLETQYLDDGKLKAKFLPARIRLAALLTNTDLPRARKLYQEVIAATPNDPPAHLGLGQCALADEDADEARRHFEHAIEFAPTYGPAHEALANLLGAQGDEAAAARHRARSAGSDAVRPSADPFALAILRQGLNLKVLLRDAGVFAQRGQFAQAERVLDLAADADPTGVLVRTNRGLLLHMQGRYQEAGEEYRRVLAVRPGHLPAQTQLAETLRALGNDADAERLLLRVLETTPADVKVLGKYCALLHDVGAPERALPLLQRALEAQPDDAGVQLGVGELLRQVGYENEALAATRKALELRPDAAPARYLLGLLLLGQGDAAAAEQAWREALRVAPAFAAPRSALLGLLNERGDYAATVQLLREGLEHAPNSAEFANSLAWVLATAPDPQQRNAEEAITWGQKAVELTNQSVPTVLDTLAAAYASAGRFDEAKHWIAEAIRLAREAGQDRNVASFEQRQALYQAGQPYHEGQ